MGIERPDGPYGVEMTAAPAWPEVDENTLRDSADAFHADRKALTEQLEDLKHHRAMMFNGAAMWSGDAASAARRDHSKRVTELESQEQASRASVNLYNNAASVVVTAKYQIIENVQKAQKLITEVTNNSQATSDQKAYFIRGLVNATRTENAQIVAAAARNLKQGPTTTPTPEPPKCKDPTELLREWDELAEKIKEHNSRTYNPSDPIEVAEYEAEYIDLNAKLLKLSSELLDCGIPTTIAPAPPR